MASSSKSSRTRAVREARFLSREQAAPMLGFRIPQDLAAVETAARRLAPPEITAAMAVPTRRWIASRNGASSAALLDASRPLRMARHALGG